MMSIEDLWEALEEAKSESGDLECARILAMLCKRIGQSGDYQQAVNIGYAGVEYFRKIGDGAGEAQLLHDIAVGHSRAKEYILAIPLLERAVDLYRTHGNGYQMGKCLAFLASSLHDVGNCEAAVQLYDDAIAFYRSDSEWVSNSGQVANEKGLCLRKQGKFALSIEAHEQARQIAAECESEWIAFYANYGIGRNWLELKDFSLAAQHFTKADDLAEFLNDVRLGCEAKTKLGEAYVRLGKYKKAGKVLIKAIEAQKQQRWLVSDSAETELQYAHALAGNGEIHAAKKIYRRLRTVFTETGKLKKAYLCTFKIATLMPTQKRAKAIALLEEVAKESSKVEGFYVPRASRVCLAELLQQSDATEDKKHALEVLAEVPEELYEDFGEFTIRYQKIKQQLVSELGEQNG